MASAAIQQAGAAQTAVIVRKSESLSAIAWRRLRRNPVAMFGLTGLLLLVLISIAAPVIAPYEPTKMDVEHPRQPPNSAHPFGTDDLGRDVLSRVIWGGRLSLSTGVAAVLLGMAGAVVVGLISGFYGGAFDMGVQRVIEIFMAFPMILLAMSVVAVMGPGLPSVLVAIAFALVPAEARMFRSSVLSTKAVEYVNAARAVGANNWRIMFRHILPNILSIIIIYSTLALGGAIMIVAGLSYLGLGAQPPAPEWGSLLLYGRPYLRTAWWMSIFPGLAIFFASLFVNLLGDGVRDALDPRSIR